MLRLKGKWITDDGGSYAALVLAAHLLGVALRFIIIDDHLEPGGRLSCNPRIKDITGTVQRSTHSRWGNSMIVMILTRWHEDDLAGRVPT